MKSSYYLVFGFDGLSYALPAEMVQEILPLPELTPTDEMPPWIRGIFYLRGKFVPVIDLDQRINNKKHFCKTSDKIVILTDGNFNPAIIVSEVYDVVEIETDKIETINKVFPETSGALFHFVEGVVNSNDSIITLLSIENLLSLWVNPGVISEIPSETEAEVEEVTIEEDSRYFSPESSEQDRLIFKARADSMKEISVDEDSTEKTAFAVVILGNEYLGIDLKTISGFCEIKKITRVPCCPPHIPGQINFHGKIITLVDISPVFKLKSSNNYRESKVIIITLEQGEAGVLVDDVEDVIYLKNSDISPSRSAINLMNDSFQKGTVHYKSRMLTLVDLEQVLLNGNLSVSDDI